MSYAQRPMGDYKTYGYAGDPGWLSSLWKKVVKPIAKYVFGTPAAAATTGVAVGMALPTQIGTPSVTPPPGSIHFTRFRTSLRRSRGMEPNGWPHG